MQIASLHLQDIFQLLLVRAIRNPVTFLGLAPHGVGHGLGDSFFQRLLVDVVASIVQQCSGDQVLDVGCRAQRNGLLACVSGLGRQAARRGKSPHYRDAFGFQCFEDGRTVLG